MSERPVVIAANWKMHKTRGEALDYAGELTAWVDEHTSGVAGVERLQVVVAPSFTALESVVETNPSFGVFAQNMHGATHGAYTGEVSAVMLADMGIHGVLLGHSERRQLFGETDEALAGKVAAALDAKLRPMLCVGETLEERNAGEAEAVVTRQLQVALGGVDAARLQGRLYVAYEPVWAIGTGETATPEVAQQMHASVRSTLAGLLGEAIAREVPVLYGGSVKPGNAAELLAQPDIDGALVGGAALEVDSFSGIIKAAIDSVAAAGVAQ